MRTHKIIATVIAASMSVVAVPAIAQTQTGLVNVALGDVTVDLQNILSNNLNNNNVAIPVNVQVPIGIAANVCGTTVALLSQKMRNGDNTCTATTANAALAKIVARNARK